MSSEIMLDIDQTNLPYWDGLKQGRLLYQQCGCGHCWMPASRLCPGCLSDKWKWVEAKGQANVVSWVVYQVAYHPEFKDKLPYNVAIVRLEEGPQMITNIVGDIAGIRVGSPVRLVIDTDQSQPLAKFALT